MEITLRVKTSTGETFELNQEVSDLTSLSKLSDLEQLVQEFGHSVLPALEGELLKHMSERFVGEKNKA